MYNRLVAPLKWHGGKYYLARKIIDLMPRHLHYVEPFAGGLSVLLTRDPNDPRLWIDGQRGVSEVVNDLDGGLINFWRVLQSIELFPQFLRMAQATPLGRIFWEEAGSDRDADPVERAWAFFVRCRQSLAGRRRLFTPLTRTRTRRGMNGNVSEWLGAVEGLPTVHERLRRVAIVGPEDAQKTICREDGPHTLFYLDPPYYPGTRTSPDVYAHEMSEEDHRSLLCLLRQAEGRVMLSGYSHPVYEEMLTGWTQHTFNVPNHASGAKKKDREIEVLWCNFKKE